MSWDLFVQHIPESVQHVDDIPDDFEPPLIGTKAELIARVLEVVPFADFSDPCWGHIDTPDFSIEVNLGEADPVCHFALHVQGSDLAVPVIAEILLHTGLRAFDPSAPSGIFEMKEASAGFQRWRAYRDRIVAPVPSDPSTGPASSAE